ncbi:MAG: hypothetical protein ACX930_08305 [Erythrobacter sp.]
MASIVSFQHGTVRQRLDLALHRELRVDERLAWEGMKLARVEFENFGLYLFALPWTAFAVFWTVMAVIGVSATETDGAGSFKWAFPLFGTPFILIGLVMLSAPFASYFQRGRILFAITDQRVLRISLGRKLSVRSVPAVRIGQVERREHPDGTGSLQLAVRVGKDSDGDQQVDHFDLGTVANVMAANRALEALSS